LIKPDYLTCGLHLYLDCEWLQPGQSATTLIKFIAPEDYPHSVWQGKIIPVQEGAKVVGHAKVVRVLNPLLLGEAPS
jgi:elongation factor Tu